MKQETVSMKPVIKMLISQIYHFLETERKSSLTFVTVFSTFGSSWGFGLK